MDYYQLYLELKKLHSHTEYLLAPIRSPLSKEALENHIADHMDFSIEAIKEQMDKINAILAD